MNGENWVSRTRSFCYAKLSYIESYYPSPPILKVKATIKPKKTLTIGLGGECHFFLPVQGNDIFFIQFFSLLRNSHHHPQQMGNSLGFGEELALPTEVYLHIASVLSACLPAPRAVPPGLLVPPLPPSSWRLVTCQRWPACRMCGAR